MTRVTDVDALVRLFAEKLRSQGIPVEATAPGSRNLRIEDGESPSSSSSRRVS